MADKDTKDAGEKKPAIVPSIEARLKIQHASDCDMGNVHALTTQHGTPFEHVLEPEFWANIAHKLRPGDTVNVHTDDMSYYAQLYVRGVGAQGSLKLPNRADVEVLLLKEWGPAKKELKDKHHEVKFMGPHTKWCVIRISDQQMVKEGFATSDEAHTHLKALGLAA